MVTPRSNPGIFYSRFFGHTFLLNTQCDCMSVLAWDADSAYNLAQGEQ
jgi:hypothetical protein